MRSRTVLFIVLAVAAALAAACLGVSVGALKAAGKPPPATTVSSPAGSTRNPAPVPGPARPSTASSQQTGQMTGSPTASPPKTPKPTASPPKPRTPKPKACSPTAAAQPPAVTILSDPPPPSATDPVHFGQVSATSFDDEAGIDISEDHQALTMTFSKFEIGRENGPGQCYLTRSLSMTLPVTGTARAGKLYFYVQGYAFAEQGTSAQLTLRGNGQVKVQRFPAGFDDSYLVALEFPVTPGATYTLSVQLELHQNPDAGRYAYLNTCAIDSRVT